MECPCVGVCMYNEETGYCEGCKLTLDEAQRWPGMTEEEQETLVQELKAREEAES